MKFAMLNRHLPKNDQKSHLKGNQNELKCTKFHTKWHKILVQLQQCEFWQKMRSSPVNLHQTFHQNFFHLKKYRDQVYLIRQYIQQHHILDGGKSVKEKESRKKCPFAI